MRYSELENQIIRNLQNRDGAMEKSLAMQAFNFSQKFISRQGEWEELEALFEGEFTLNKNEYTLTGGTPDFALTRPISKKRYTVKVNDGSRWREPMQFVLPNKWDSEVEGVTFPSGVPSRYTVWAGLMTIDRLPPCTYSMKIRYYQYPNPITEVTDTVQLEDADQALVAMTTAYSWYALGERELADKWMKLAQNLVSGIVRDARSLPNFETYSGEKTSGTPWADPFEKG